MPAYRKKPVVIEAVQWTGYNLDEIEAFVGSFCRVKNGKIPIRTLEGTMFASYDDWIIKGVSNEIYPCKPDIFEATYEEVTA